MKGLVVELGSMGKRRVRNLKTIGGIEVFGFDPRPDRRLEAENKYEIPTYSEFREAIEKANPDFLVISTPPDLHMEYAYRGFELGLHCFIEASVVDADKILELSKIAPTKNLVMAPSCTMKFFPGPKIIKSLLDKKAIGKVIAWNYHTGQRLEEWHPWEDISDYYVSKKETGGAREIVPFELTWLNELFGTPEVLSGFKGKVSDMKADIDDIYSCSFLYPGNIFASLTVEVISKYRASRLLRILGDDGQIIFDSTKGIVELVNSAHPDSKSFEVANGTIEKLYINPEEPYISELSHFLDAVKLNQPKIFPNSLKEDYLILQQLYQIERMALNE